MAETSGFFNAHVVNGEHDRVYLAEQFAKYFASFISNGVFGGKLSELMVVQHADGGMKVSVLPGMGWINGFWYENSDNVTVDIAVSDGVVNRIDNIVLRWGKLERNIWVDIIRGTPATNAVAPAIERNTEYYDLKLAEIHVKAGLSSITYENIVDTRIYNDVCGFVVGVINQIDTTEYARQLNGFISSYAAEFKAFLEDIELTGTKEIDSLVSRLIDLIEDESALATLAFKTDNIASETVLLSQTLGFNKKNLIPYPFVNNVGDVAEFAGVTWTDLGDGTVKGNGTASANSYFTLYEGDIYLKPGKYKLTSGFNDSASAYVFFVKIHKTTGEYANRTTSYNDIAIEITESDIENYKILISTFLTAGGSLSNVIMKPMLRRAEILDDTWEPYKLSVAEMIQEDEIEKGCFYRLNRATGIKEWINPPCKSGIEYCTTERWNNKPIYQMTFYVASLPINSVMSIETNSQWDKVVSVSGYAHDSDDLTYYPFPVILGGQLTPVAMINRIESEGNIVITTNDDVSYMQAYVTIRYTK